MMQKKKKINNMERSNNTYNSDYSSSDGIWVAAIFNNEYHEIMPQNKKGEIGNHTISLPLDSGSVCSNVTKDKAELVSDNSEEAKWLTETKKRAP